MDLARLGNAEFRKSEDAVQREPEYNEVNVIFRSFGLGSEKTSDFRVEFVWQDVENLISEFAAMKEPSAVALQQAKSLSVAVRRAGWTPGVSN